MWTRFAFVIAVALSSNFALPVGAAQQTNGDSSQSSDSSTQSDTTVEGTVVSSSPQTLVVRLDNNQFRLFTYQSASVPPRSLRQGLRVRITAGAADENGGRTANSVEIIATNQSSGATADKGAQAAPVPAKVRDVESDIRREARHWRLGVRAGAAFDPELFSFGVQSQIGPIFHSRVYFRPNAEFAFGEVTDLISVNLEGIYRFSDASRVRKWTPYVGAGPALIFIHQSFESGRDISFGNFDYETGFNVLVGAQSRTGTFVELKSSLYSGPAPKLRLIVGYIF
jgi:hypothetical protein